MTLVYVWNGFKCVVCSGIVHADCYWESRKLHSEVTRSAWRNSCENNFPISPPVCLLFSIIRIKIIYIFSIIIRLPVWQCWSVYPGAHWHRYPLIWSVQVPSFWQGALTHPSMYVSINFKKSRFPMRRSVSILTFNVCIVSYVPRSQVFSTAPISSSTISNWSVFGVCWNKFRHVHDVI